MLHSELTLTRVIRGVFLWVVWTLDDTIFTVANVSTAVPELILGLHHHHYTHGLHHHEHQHPHLHELVSALEPAEHALAVGVEMHLKTHGALGAHHGPGGGLVAVSEMETMWTMWRSKMSNIQEKINWRKDWMLIWMGLVCEAVSAKGNEVKGRCIYTNLK